MYSKIKSLKSASDNKEKFSLMEQLRGISQFIWLASFIFTVFVLYKYFSPVITKLAMESVIAPVAALTLIVIGEFDYSKLTQMLASNVGVVLKITGVLILGLFLQNVVKSAVFMQSFTKGHEKYRTYALASLLTPVTTAALWYVFTHFGYFMATKTISIGMLAMFASGEAAEVLKNVKSVDTISTDDLSNVARAMSNMLRIGLGVLLCIHLYFVYVSYKAIHRMYHLAFDAILLHSIPVAQKVFAWVKAGFNVATNFMARKLLWVLAISIIAAVIYFIPFSQIFTRSSSIEKVSCNYGYTQVRLGSGKDWTLKTVNGKGVCFEPEAYKYLKVGDAFHIDNIEYRRLVIEDGFTALCSTNNGPYACKRDYIFPHDQIFWVQGAATSVDGNTVPSRYRGASPRPAGASGN